ncbi:TauD/TfdA family dioxygenase [Alphaproteobacteria bacterium]|nr:TauD/TfdA family dioxygenase [Alphaproteobacteria bacterium]
MTHKISSLNGNFGTIIEGVSRRNLLSFEFKEQVYELWTDHGGLVGLRGTDLAQLTANELMDWAACFGDIDHDNFVAREDRKVDGLPILRIGNTSDELGNKNSNFSKVPSLRNDSDIRYNPETRRPVWHTDSTFRQEPPIGSVFHCRKAPPSGGETLFADTRSSLKIINPEQRKCIEGLEAICSLAHHDKKISLYSPGYPTLDQKERVANPPNRVPLVLTHPISGEPAIYGLNSSTCAIVPKGQKVSQSDLDYWDLEGREDDSVKILRDLLPFMTSPEFTVKWTWQEGDIVIWDNRCTMHAATGFDDKSHIREMWRLTLLQSNTKVVLDHSC